MKNIVSQWVYPHLTALAYMRYNELVINVGADLQEIYSKGSCIHIEQMKISETKSKKLTRSIKILI